MKNITEDNKIKNKLMFSKMLFRFLIKKIYLINGFKKNSKL